MPDYSKWSIKKLRTLLFELQNGGLRAKEMQTVLHIENLILEKQK